jgi:uncharacterized alkaline shock family protein YloU
MNVNIGGACENDVSARSKLTISADSIRALAARAALDVSGVASIYGGMASGVAVALGGERRHSGTKAASGDKAASGAKAAAGDKVASGAKAAVGDKSLSGSEAAIVDVQAGHGAKAASGDKAASGAKAAAGDKAASGAKAAVGDKSLSGPEAAIVDVQAGHGAKAVAAEVQAGHGAKAAAEYDSVSVSVSIVTAYGARIPEIAWNVQESVKKSIEGYAGIRVLKVNVLISGISKT